jgi:hypothetical protein
MTSMVRRQTVATLVAFMLFWVSLATFAPRAPSATPSTVPVGTIWTASPGPIVLNVTPWDGEIVGTATPVIMVAYADTSPGAAIVAVHFLLDGMNLTSAGHSNESAFVLPLALELRSGPHLANFTGIDNFGEIAFANWTFTVDTVPPVLFVTAPTYPVVPTAAVLVEGSALLASPVFAGAAPINVTATVLPSQLTRWTFAAANGSFSLPVPLIEGVNTIFVNATDRVGNFATEVRSVIRDTVKPSLVVLTPANMSVSPTTLVRVSGISEFGAYLTVNGFSVAVAPNGTWSVELALPDGAQPIVVVAADAAGNTHAVVLVVLVDSDIPQVTLTSPLVPLTNRSDVVVSGYVSDSAVVAIFVNLVSVPFDASSGYFSTAVSLPDGLNPVVVVAVDAAQHQGVAQTAILVDTTAPIIYLTGPPDGLETNQSTVVVSGTVNDSNATVLVNGLQVRASSSGTWRTTVALLQGVNTIVVSAVDAAGNPAKEIRILATYYPPWYGLDNRIVENEKSFRAWEAILSLGLAAVLIFLTALVLALYLRMDKRIVRLRGLRLVKSPPKPAQPPPENDKRE